LQASLDQARDTPAGSGWDRKAAAHAEFFTALADVAGDPCAAPVLNHGAGLAYDLMIGAGRAADGMVISSRRRMLIHLRAGHPEQAARNGKAPSDPLLHEPPGHERVPRISVTPIPPGMIIFFLNGRWFYLTAISRMRAQARGGHKTKLSMIAASSTGASPCTLWPASAT
jgi:hypothetical protein